MGVYNAIRDSTKLKKLYKLIQSLVSVYPSLSVCLSVSLSVNFALIEMLMHLKIDNCPTWLHVGFSAKLKTSWG